MRVTKILLALLLVAMSPFTAAQTSEWIPIKIDNGKILVNTTFAGIDGYSVIDTGSNWSAINTRFLEKHRIDLNATGETQVSGFFQSKQRPFYTNIPATVFGTPTRFAYLGEVTLTSDTTQLLIGGDLLKQNIFQFDYPNQRMRWLTRDSLDLKTISNVPSKVDKHSQRVIAKVNLNNQQDLWVTVDTGAASGLWIDRSLAAKRGWLKKHHATSARARGANAEGNIEQFRLPTVNIDEFETNNTLVSVTAADQPNQLFERSTRPGSKMQRPKGKSRGLLGWDALKHFVLTIDYRIGKIHLEPSAPA